ncbi:MAG: response regulator [Gemmatimonadetes bacterium]|nr:response regulator [Gemmatimonadota bacterium]
MPQKPDPESRNNAPRVLVVDDHRDTADSLAQALVLSGYSAQAAYDGASALKFAREFRPHVAMLDIGMPVMDGYELARRLRATPETSATHLIAFTGYAEELLRRHTEAGGQAGFEQYLVKPVDIAQVVAAIRRLLSEDSAPLDIRDSPKP